MSKIRHRKLLLATAFLLLWIIVAESCFTFRSSDQVMVNKFREEGVELKMFNKTVHKRNIHFAVSGNDSAATIVFLHGTPGSWNAFQDYMKDPELLKRFRMISIDRPGFGHSDFGMPENLANQSALIGPVLREISNQKPVYLAGHSLGGPMIVQLAADNPALVSGLIMISASVDPKEEKPEKWRPVLFKTPLNFLVPGAFRPSNVELWYLKTDLINLRKRFAEIRCPVYFIHGTNDSWVPPGNVEYAKKLLTNTEVKEYMIEGGNHFIPWTKYSEIKNVLLQLN